MKEILVVSGKGGTGKTSITAAFASCFKNVVLADCDVDASDLHLIFEPNILEEHEFISGHEAYIRPDDCINCGKCEEVCRFDAVKLNDSGKYFIDPIACEGCGVCTWSCPQENIDFNESVSGKWFISETRFGPMVHAKLNAAAENSGKLVSEVRFKANLVAQENDAEYLLIDGPPGIGCPVIAAMTGVKYIVIVTEPTLTGKHDMKRVVSLAKNFDSHIYLVINKFDINEELSDEISGFASHNKIPLLGKVHYDHEFTRAMIDKKTIIETVDSIAKIEVNKIFNKLNYYIKGENYENSNTNSK